MDLSLRLAPEWSNVEHARRGVHAVVRAAGGSETVANELGMVTSELVENALRYGPAGSGVDLKVHGDQRGLTVEVTNACATPDQVRELQARIARMSAAEDPAQLYREAIEERAASMREGGLGLARIVYEGRCRLACDLSRPGAVTVRAFCSDPARNDTA